MYQGTFRDRVLIKCCFATWITTQHWVLLYLKNCSYSTPSLLSTLNVTVYCLTRTYYKRVVLVYFRRKKFKTIFSKLTRNNCPRFSHFSKTMLYFRLKQALL